MAKVARLATARLPEAPEHLSRERREFWERLTGTYAFDPAGLELLRLAAEALDRVEEARRIVAEEGPVVQGRFGAKAHPLLAVERDARIAVCRLLRELGLEQEQARSPLELRPRRSDHR